MNLDLCRIFSVACHFQTRTAHYSRNISDAAARVVLVNQVAETWSHWSVHDESGGTAACGCRHRGRSAAERSFLRVNI